MKFLLALIFLLSSTFVFGTALGGGASSSCQKAIAHLKTVTVSSAEIKRYASKCNSLLAKRPNLLKKFKTKQLFMKACAYAYIHFPKGNGNVSKITTDGFKDCSHACNAGFSSCCCNCTCCEIWGCC